MVVDEVDVVVVRASTFEDRNHNAGSIGRLASCGDVPGQI